MQTFLPFPDFAESANVLDTARLGKQRVEALQLLRAIVLPTYGWKNHPATQMWRRHVPALTSYALTMAEEWTSRGHADHTRPLIAEFAPNAGTGSAPGALPSWLGSEALHLSHRSNLVRKDPEFYRPLFPGVPDDLPYVWPGPDPDVSSEVAPLAAAGASSSPTWILRPRDAREFEEWTSQGAVSLGALSPLGKRTPKWQAQLEAFAALEPGTPIAVLTVDGDSLVRGAVTGSVISSTDERGEPILRLPVDFRGEVSRRAFRYPALLQDPRTLFAV